MMSDMLQLEVEKGESCREPWDQPGASVRAFRVNWWIVLIRHVLDDPRTHTKTHEKTRAMNLIRGC